MDIQKKLLAQNIGDFYLLICLKECISPAAFHARALNKKHLMMRRDKVELDNIAKIDITI